MVASPTSTLDLSVVVPLYNEEESLPELVEQLLKTIAEVPFVGVTEEQE